MPKGRRASEDESGLDIPELPPEDAPVAEEEAQQEQETDVEDARLRAREAEARADAAKAKAARMANEKRRTAEVKADPFRGTIFAGVNAADIDKYRIRRIWCQCPEHQGAKHGTVATIPAAEFTSDPEEAIGILQANWQGGCYRIEGLNSHSRYVLNASMAPVVIPGEPNEFDDNEVEPGVGAATAQASQKRRSRPGDPIFIPKGCTPIKDRYGAIAGIKEGDEDDEATGRGNSNAEYLQMIAQEREKQQEERAAEEERKEKASLTMFQMLQANQASMLSAQQSNQATLQANNQAMLQALEAKNAAVTAQLTALTTSMVQMAQESARQQASAMQAFSTAQVAAAQKAAEAQVQSAHEHAKAQIIAAKEMAAAQLAFIEKQQGKAADVEGKAMAMMMDTQSKCSAMMAESQMKAITGHHEIVKTGLQAAIEQIGAKDTWVATVQDLKIPEMAQSIIERIGGAKSQHPLNSGTALVPQDNRAVEVPPQVPYAHPQFGAIMLDAMAKGHEGVRFAEIAEKELLGANAVLDLEKLASTPGLNPGGKVDQFVTAWKKHLSPPIEAAAKEPNGRAWLWDFLGAFQVSAEEEMVEEPHEAAASEAKKEAK